MSSLFVFAALSLFAPTDETGVAIQRAIDAANAAGGGRVALKAAVYPSGTLYMRDNVELHIPEGAVLLGGETPDEYDDVDDPRIGIRPERTSKVFVAAVGCTNVAITGGGVIDGRGVGFYSGSTNEWGKFSKPSCQRPRMIEFVKCRNVRFEDITFKDSPGWTCWLRMCEDVVAERVKIHGDQRMINNDGFDIDGCRRVHIRNCDVKTGDDSIAVRAMRLPDGDAEICEDLLVEDCTLDSNCQAIRFGCPSDGEIRRGTFRRLKLRGLHGITCGHPTHYLAKGDHGYCLMRDLLVEDCDIDAVYAPINFFAAPGVCLRAYGNVTFRNVRLRGSWPIKLQGTGDSVLKNVRFENVSGFISSDTPMEMRSVENVVFDGFDVTSGPGKKTHPAMNQDESCWERDR